MRLTSVLADGLFILILGVWARVDHVADGIHPVADDARLARKEWADCADLPQDACAQIIPFGAALRTSQDTRDHAQNGGSARVLIDPLHHSA